MRKQTNLILLLLILAAGNAFAGDWPSWRGPFQTGVSPEKGLISSWSAKGENLIWRSDFIGRSTPVIMNGRVYVSGRTGTGPTMQEHIACFDADSGKKIWEKKFNVYLSTVPYTRVGWASLVGDPETGNVYAHGVGGLLICLDKDGKLVWMRSLTEEYGHVSGYGGRTDTAVVDENLVILGFVNSGWGEQAPLRHRIFAWDKKTGELVWVSTPGNQPYDFNIYSTPVVTMINGQRLLIGGNGDGAVYAVKVRTGEKVWGFNLSKRGINSSVVVEGTRVYATHSEENLDEATMGRLVAIDATGTGDITKTHELWRYDRLEAGYASPAVQDGKVYVVDNSANLYTLDSTSGKLLWKHNLGTVGKGSPVLADGKMYATEVNGNVVILQLSDAGAKELDTERIMTPTTSGSMRHAEIYGSVAIAYGRLYFTTEEGIYCLGTKGSGLKVTTTSAALKEEPADPNGPATWAQVIPGEILVKPGETAQFRVRTYDAKGRFLKETKPVWTVSNPAGAIDEAGKFTAGAKAAGGVITAQAGEIKANARFRIIPDLPLKEDFEGIEAGKNPAYWLGVGTKFVVQQKEANKVLAKPPVERGLQSQDVYIGPPSMTNYTIQADVMGTKVKRKTSDIGLINSGYSFYLEGSHQRAHLFTWGSEYRVDKKLDFPWEPDVWYTMKLRVENTGGKGNIRGKVWRKGDAEPEAWTLEMEDSLPVTNGSPGIYGNSNTEIFFDNVQVTRN